MDIFKTACSIWSSIYSTEQKDAWDQRAKRLNKRRIPGEYAALPLCLYNSNIYELTRAIQQSLNLEWQELRRLWKCLLTRSMAFKARQKHYTFGKEVVKIGRQSYGCFFLSLLLRQSLFGNNNNLFLKTEVVRKTKKKTLIHIASTRQMKDIFSQNGECASSFQCNSPSNVPLKENTCAGKVFLTLKGKNLTGYVVDERSSS